MRGLLGKKLSHSFSKEIHEKIDQITYNLLETDDLSSFFHEKNFSGINVTIPYKKEVIRFLDTISDQASSLQTVNTIVNTNGKLFGYNTDVNGFDYLLEYHKINVSNKVIGIIGNGATMRTIHYVLSTKKVKEILVFARNPIDNETSLEDTTAMNDVDILINCTPNGMYPNNNDDLIVDFDNLKKCNIVIDLIYNPLRTQLLVEAEKRNKRAVNGLMMLVHQAVEANAIFNNSKIDFTISNKIYKELLLEKLNLVIIGMPMSGKSFYSKLLSKRFNKDLIDLDQEVVEHSGNSINNIFQTHGESVFRKLESEVIDKSYKLNNKAISTGGGVVEKENNIDKLKQNGLILFLDMPLKDLKKCNPKDRPLLKDSKNIDKLYNRRYNLYNKYADKRIIKQGFKETVNLKRIEVAINEYISN